MSNSIRSKFKGAKISALKETRKEAESKSKSNGNNWPGFHKIEDGVNIFRIAPPHGEDEPSIQAFRSTWLDCEVPVLDDNKKETGKTEIKKKRIFIATQHGGLEKDPIELYIDYVYKSVYDKYQDKDERAKKLSPITGWRDKSGKWNPGIKPSTNYVAYAWKDGELGRIEFYQSIVKRMEELNVAEQADEPIEIDIFSDPDEGVSLIVEKGKNDQGKNEWIVRKKEFDLSKYMKKAGSEEEALKMWKEDKKSEIITDAQLEELLKQKSLKELYVDVYSMRDFDFAISGLQMFDEKNKFDIFENEEFIEELNEIKTLVPEKTEKKRMEDGDDIEEALTRKESKSSDEDTSKWSKPKCKKYLEAYILDNYGNDEVLPELDLDELRDWCSLATQDEELPFEDYKEEVEENEEEEEDASDAKTIEEVEEANPDLAAKLAKLRKRKK